MKNLTKKIFLTVFTGLIIIIFGAWGMGDVFTSNKNIVVRVGNEKVYIQDYINEAKIYTQKNNKNFLNDNDHFNILNTLITQKVYENFTKDQGILINDQSLAFYLQSNDEFKDDDGKFSRIRYEKYLLEKNINAATLEYFLKKDLIKNISFKTYLSGISIPNYHSKKLKNDLLKTVEADFYTIDTDKKVSDREIEQYFKKNRSNFTLGELRSGFIFELSAANLGYKNNNNDYYQSLSEIENSIINNDSFEEIVSKFNLKPNLIEEININGINKNQILSKQKNYAKSLFTLNKSIQSEIFDIGEKKYLISLKNINNNHEVSLNEIIKRKISDKILKKNNIKTANKILQTIKSNKKEFFNYAMSNKLKINNMIFQNITDNKKIFNQSNMEKIFEASKKNPFILLEDKKVYLFNVKKIGKSKNKIDNLDKIIKNQIKEEFRSMIIRDFDTYLIKKYPVKINDQAFQTVKKSI